MSLFSKVELKELKQSNQKVIRIAVSNVPVNPTIAITTSNKIHLFNQSGQKHQYELSRSITPTCIQWHPINPILAIGWDNGRVTIWNEDTKAPKEETKPHVDPIMLIRFNPSGNRMVTSDLTGMVAIWRGINLLACYQKDWAITHCLFCDINFEGNKSNFGNLFLFAGRSGTVCLANDMNMCSDVCRVGGTIKALIFYQKQGSAIVITSTLLLVQFKINFTEKSVPERKVKLSISGEPQNLSSIWIGSCLLATCSNQNMIRFWHLQEDQNYNLTVFDVLNNQEGNAFTSDKISSIVYDTRGRSLVAGTRDGRLLFWKNMALGSQSPIDKQQWSPQPFLNLGKSIQLLTVGKNNGVIVCKQSDGEVIIVTQTRVTGKMSDTFKILLTSAENIEITYESGNIKKEMTFNTGTNIKGIDIKDDIILYWTNKKIELLRIKVSDIISVDKLGSINQKAVNSAIISSQIVIVSTDYGFNQINLSGQIKQTISFPQSEGKVLGFHIMGNFLVIWTQNSYLRIFSISTKQSKQISITRKFEDSTGPLGFIKSCQINSDGTKVGIVANKPTAAQSPSNSFYIYDTQVDNFIGYDLGVDKVPVAIFWDRKDKRFFGVQTQFTKAGQSQNKEDRKKKKIQQQDQENEQQKQDNQDSKFMGRDFLTFFCTTQTGIRYQDKYILNPNILGIFSLKIPFLYLIDRSKKETYSIKRMILHDFSRLNYDDQVIKTSILNFSFHLTSGNLDQAYKSVKSIQNPAIWQKMAAMCVKSKRLDVAQICIGNMRFARGARSIRQSKKQPELQTQLAMVAIQLGMPDEAKALYENCKRYDLLNKMNQANGQPQEAIQIAQKLDRIDLKNTYYNAAKFYEASNDFTKAIQYYEKSGTHCKQVPRMLLESQRIKQLQDYINQKKQKELYLWIGQYKQSIGQINEAIKYYNASNSTSNLVRLHLSQQQLEQSIKICNAQSQPQACFLLARYFQKQGKLSDAIHFYAKAQYYSQAIKIAIDRQLDGQIMNLSMMSPKQVVFRSASYFEKKGLIQKAIVLYRKAGATKKSVDMAIKYNIKQYIRPEEIVNDEVQEEGAKGNQDLATLNNRVNGFIDAGKYDRAVPFLINAKQYQRALDICIQYNVPITEELVQNMLPEKQGMTAQQTNKQNDLIKTIAEKCRKQGAFQLASQLYIRLGDKIKAMKSLIELGDQQKIIKFATNARMPEIFILAGNYLQTADWNKNTNLMKFIITFYTKAKAYDNLAGFFEACSSVEIDQYRNYQKALSALKQALKNAQLSTGQQKQSRIVTIKQKIDLTDRFLKAQAICETDAAAFIKQCEVLLSIPQIEQAVRIGDIFSLMIQYYYEMKNYNACYDLLKKMQERKIIATPYIDQEIIQNVYAALGIRNLKHQKKKEVEQEIVQEDIRY